MEYNVISLENGTSTKKLSGLSVGELRKFLVELYDEVDSGYTPLFLNLIGSTEGSTKEEYEHFIYEELNVEDILHKRIDISSNNWISVRQD